MKSSKYLINAASCLTLALVTSTGSLVSLAQSPPLKIPRGAAEYKELLKDDDGKPCTTCGVVASLRTESTTSSSERAPNAPLNPGLDAGPGGDLSTVPIGIKGAAKPPKPDVVYIISVKYDNGAYAHIEQDDEPKLKKGERVRVTDGRVVPDPR